MAGYKIFRKILAIRPDMIVINTPELLPLAIVNRLFFRRKIMYDILENYYRNIRHTTVYPLPARWPLALVVRTLEKITAPFMHHFFLAENGYQKEIGFAKPFTILENKLPKSVAQLHKCKTPRDNHQLLFTGTLAKSTGVFEAIKLSRELHAIDSRYSLSIIGYCALPDDLAEIKAEIKKSPFISLHGGDRLVPHHEILQATSHAGWGIVIYPPNPSTESSIPTKVYEYLALQLPMIIRHNPQSHEMVKKFDGGIILPDQFRYYDLANQLKIHPPNSVMSVDVCWESEAPKLIECLRNL